MKLRAIVADDEQQARKRIVRLLEALDVEVVAACASAAEVLVHYPRLLPDLLVLDISMPGSSGLELHGKLPDATVIFVTAHAEHALEAYELGAVDYVMKPVAAARLAKALARIRPTPSVAADKLPVETRGGVVLVDPAQLLYAAFDGALVTLHAAHESWITTLSLKDLEHKLPPQFARVDRRHVLNLDRVARLEPESDGGYRAHVEGGAVVPISRQAARDLRRRLGY
jgi:two-component system, LytTR family, response regulator